MAGYATAFLGLVLVVLPAAARRFDGLVPDWHIEIGGWRWAGALVLAGGLGLYVHAAWTLVQHGRGAYVEFDPPRELVTAGPFRHCRNPIALGLLGMLLGEAIAFSSTGILLLFVLATCLAVVQVRWLEEPLLRRRFGQAYEEYCQRVPRWLPRPWRR